MGEEDWTRVMMSALRLIAWESRAMTSWLNLCVNFTNVNPTSTNVFTKKFLFFVLRSLKDRFFKKCACDLLTQHVSSPCPSGERWSHG